MYSIIVLDTKTKQEITHHNLDRHDSMNLVRVCLKSHYLNCYVVNFQNEKIKGLDWLNGLERG